MKVGNLIKGLEVVDVKQVNKLNLIQFLKEVDSYLQNGYQIDVTSGRQVGLVLQCKMFKTEAASSVKVGSVGGQVPTESVGSKEAEPVSKEDTSVPEESIVTESTVQQEQVNSEAVAEPVEEVAKEEVSVAEEIAPPTAKKTTTRSKKTVQ